MTKVWLTRTSPAVLDSADVWRAAGFTPLVEPLLTIETVPHTPPSDKAVLIFTSKNGVDHVSCQGQRAICVGDATAEKARDTGYRDVVSVDGTSANVTEWVVENLPKTQPICHVSGQHVRGSITEDLSSAGYTAQRVIVYRSDPKPIWPKTSVSLVALYSPLAATCFAEQAKNKDVSALTAICISQTTADELSCLTMKSVIVAKHPREDELIMAATIAFSQALDVKG